MNLTEDQQLRLVSVLGCLVESAKPQEHSQSCTCQLCQDILSAQAVLLTLSNPHEARASGLCLFWGGNGSVLRLGIGEVARLAMTRLSSPDDGPISIT